MARQQASGEEVYGPASANPTFGVEAEHASEGHVREAVPDHGRELQAHGDAGEQPVVQAEDAEERGAQRGHIEHRGEASHGRAHALALLGRSHEEARGAHAEQAAQRVLECEGRGVAGEQRAKGEQRGE
eukprot:scaffold19746_cov67-Phaeocystis_antarctica.AAC.8